MHPEMHRHRSSTLATNPAAMSTACFLAVGNAVRARRTRAHLGARSVCVATLTNPEDELRARFARADDALSQPKRTFLPRDAQHRRAPTPNERVLAQIEQSMQRLRVADAPPTPVARDPVDISRVNPLSAYAGAAVAALISAAVWMLLRYTVQLFLAHPLASDLYVVQRISAVVRTVLVCLFALGSGISGVTALGLFALALRTTAAAITGEFAGDDLE